MNNTNTDIREKGLPMIEWFVKREREIGERD